MTEELWPYNLPIFRRSYCAQSPDGHRTAQVDPATEKGMSNPTSGTLCVTGGPHIEGCNPSFIWSDDSRYLAVPQFHGFLGRQRILIVAFESKRIFASNQREWNFQPESFWQGKLVVRINPASKSTRLTRAEGVRVFPLENSSPSWDKMVHAQSSKQLPVEPSEPRHGVEMSVAAHDREGVLTAQRCHPNVIRWNRCSGLL
jgi:hypothetical protein